MVARIPLIVNPDAAQIQELPATDTIDFPVATLTADGTIAADSAVILTSAGKAKAIETVAESSGSSTTWLTGSASEAVYKLHGGTFMKGLGSGVHDNVVIAAWQLKSTTGSIDQRLYLQCGTLSGTTITWSTTRVDTGEAVDNVAIASDGNGRGLLMYTLGSAVRVRTFYVPTSGNSSLPIDWGDVETVQANSGEGSLRYLGISGSSAYFAVAYKNTAGSGNESYVRIIKHDGDNNISIGPQVQVEGATTNAHSTTHLIPISHDKFIVQVGQLNGNTTMNVCTRVYFGNSNSTDVHVGPAYTSQELGRSADPVYLHNDHYNGSAYDTINKKFIIWHNKGNEQEGVVRVYDIVGNSINFQFESNFVYDDVEHTHHSMYPTVQVTDKGQIVVTYNLDSNNHGKRVVGSYNHDRTRIYWSSNGATPSGSGASTWSSEDTRYAQQVKADDGKIINLFTNGDGSSYNTSGKSIVFQTTTTTLTSDNFLGFSSAGYSDGDAARIKVLGNTLTKGGLTIGEKYYVRDDGVLVIKDAFPYQSTNFKVVAGKAIAANKLLITPV